MIEKGWGEPAVEPIKEVFIYGEVEPVEYYLNMQYTDLGLYVGWLRFPNNLIEELYTFGDRLYYRVQLRDIIDHIGMSDFPDEEDAAMRVRWGIEYLDGNRQTISKTGVGRWSDGLLRELLEYSQQLAGDAEPFQCMFEMMDQ